MDTRAPNKADMGIKLLNGASQPPKNNKLRLPRQLSFGKQGACSSTGQKCHHFTRSKGAHMKLEVEDLNTASPCRASSSSLGFTSFTGFMATPERIIDTDQKEFGDNDTSDIDLEVPRQRKVMGERTPPIYLKFADVKLKVVTKGIGNNTEKEIVNKISGSASPGEFLAFMGPSGSGKTSMLNLLGGRITNNRNNHLVDGYITYNDKPYSKSLKRRIGFVTQDDILYAHLTVKETLTYTALLRLPKTTTRRHKEERVMNVIYELGLERCQDTMIGGAAVRGVSGGERKRVCIGNEIIINPSLLFLDEPTSGLDSTTALKVVQMLHQIAEGGKTVVSTIHQPSSRMFHKFDKLVVLGKGRLLYFGQASEVTTYFSSLGFSPLIPMNPAEFLLDLANGNTTDISVPLELENKVQVEKLTSEVQSCFNPSPIHVHEYLVEAYETGVAPQLRKQLVMPIPFQPDLRGPRREWEASWWQQFSVLFIRGLKERKHDYLSWMRISQVLATAIILGLLWWHSDSTTPKGLQDQVGLLFFIALFWGFIPVSMAIFTFPQERAVINKERAVDMYRLSAYFMARTTSDLPLDLLLPLVFVTISYFMAGLRLGVAPFSLTILTVFLNIITAQGLGLAIGAALSDIKKASTLASVTVMTFMLAGGFFLKNVPPFLSWVRYLSFTYHTYRLLLKLQYDRVPTYIDGSDVGNGIKEVVLMVTMIFVYRVLAYIFLRMKLPNF